MKNAWMKVGLISTVFIDIWDGLTDNETHMTSLDHKIFWKYIQEAENKGYTHMVIEVSSHALYQYRTRPLMFEWVGCTNITREHLDFHATMDHYVRSKAELYARTTPDALWVLPIDFAYTSDFSHDGLELMKFGYNDAADIWVQNIQENGELKFDLHTKQWTARINTRIVWAFNADNMMIAAVLAMRVWLDLEQVVSGLSSFEWLPGRQELVMTKEGVTGMIDFAVTPDGLKTLYMAVRKMGYQKIIAVFGATGNRDQGKRPKMGAIAAQTCDVVIITEDENYHEDGLKIMQAVADWIDHKITDTKVELVQDRSQAIKRGLELAWPGDVVVVTWMANFTTRAMNEGDIPWNEREVIHEQMNILGLHVEQ